MAVHMVQTPCLITVMTRSTQGPTAFERVCVLVGEWSCNTSISCLELTNIFHRFVQLFDSRKVPCLEGFLVLLLLLFPLGLDKGLIRFLFGTDKCDSDISLLECSDIVCSVTTHKHFQILLLQFLHDEFLLVR